MCQLIEVPLLLLDLLPFIPGHPKMGQRRRELPVGLGSMTCHPEAVDRHILWVFLPPSCGLVYLIDYGFEKDIQHHPRLHCGLVVRAGDCPLVSLSVLDVIRIVFFAIAIVFGSLAILAGLVVIVAALVVIISDSLFIAIYVLFALRDLLYVVFSSLSAVLDGFAIAFDRLGVFFRGFLDCPRRVPVIVMAVFFLKGYHIALRLVSLDFATYVSSQCAPIASAPSYPFVRRVWCSGHWRPHGAR
jgi:hypothetical protein